MIKVPKWHFVVDKKVPACYNTLEVRKMSLKQLRLSKGLTQQKCAEYLGVSLRSYKRYEADESKINALKADAIRRALEAYGVIDETHGTLTVDQIKAVCGEVFSAYRVEYGYLFGSYAKGKETETSDVDLLVSVPADALKFYELIEVLRERLKKRVDLLDANQLPNNPALMREILKDGVKIYG